ncbi:MAG: type II toxin-antitoxin system VapC family toxin, partial [Acidobacteriota bacterium]
MAAYFFDSSALMKRYANETGTAWVVGIFKPALANRIYVAQITLVEVIAALTRRTRSGRLNPTATAKGISRFRRAFDDPFRKVEITEALIQKASLLAEKHALRGYDAVQLASALWANSNRLVAGA